MRNVVLILGTIALLSGCGKKQKEVAKTDNGGSGGNSDFMAVDSGRVINGGGNASNPAGAPPPPTGNNTNFQTGAGAAQNIRKAGKRTVTLNDMKTLGQSIAYTVQLDDRMPSADEVKQSLQREAPNVLAAINDGSIVLVCKNKTGLWAYETDADKFGGIVLVSGTPNRASADEVKQYLANSK